MPDSGERGPQAVTAKDAVVHLRAGAIDLGLAPAAGGAIAWFRSATGAGSIDWLRPATPAALAAGHVDAMGCFPLVPFSNRIRDGRFRFRGQIVEMPPNVAGQAHVEHGHGWQSAWSVVAQSDTAATLELTRAADAWPFPYVARQAFVLAPDGLAITLSVRNAGPRPMPVGLGLHPYFPRSPATRLTAEVGQMWATDRDVLPTALVDSPTSCCFDRGVAIDAVDLDNAFVDWRRAATIAWPDRGASLTMSASLPLSFLVVYSPPGADYFCAEPVSNCTDAFNLAAAGRDDTGMLVLEPGADIAATVRFACTITQQGTGKGEAT